MTEGWFWKVKRAGSPLCNGCRRCVSPGVGPKLFQCLLGPRMAGMKAESTFTVNYDPGNPDRINTSWGVNSSLTGSRPRDLSCYLPGSVLGPRDFYMCPT